MQQPTTPTAPLDAATLARFDALTTDERARVARLMMTTGCTLGQAVAAVLATRAELTKETPSC